MKENMLDYDKENDILFIHRKDIKTKGSVEVLGGDIIIDFSKDKQVVGIEIMNASELLKPYNITKSMLLGALAGNIKVVQQRNLLFLTIVLKMPKNVEKEAILTVPSLVSEPSPVAVEA
ncbi:MAG: DUF2283 domain-containing protein [Candidatus Woesearchaeota archaeon]|jgi:uncharacterized protein YuzE|nr:DUF2283 domain-containing protein [Candidatus Woesearchaeota archaeon]|tara:strand:+ start:900 stop:1256 length:357 start_codon:yes stop_codon:yes gene_type:complete